MQHLDNNMDELFRKAAEDYPLKTNIGGWDDIVPLIAVAAPLTISEKKRKPSLTTRLLLFFSIIALFVAGYQLANTNRNATGVTKNKPKTSPVEIPANTVVDNAVIEKKLAAPVIDVDFLVQQKQINNKSAKYKPVTNLNEKITNSSFRKNEDESSSNAGRPVVFPMYSFGPIPPIIIHHTILNKLSDISRSTKKTSAEAIALLNKSGGNISRFYIGLEGGLQLNEVKGQGFTKTGFSAGVIAGFRFNKKLSVETGIAWSQKHFYTDGKYFNMAKAVASMPSNMQVMSMSSCSNLLEIPVTVNYNLIQNKSSNLFLSAGISSFILTKESNNYLAIINGQQQNAQGKYMSQRGYFSAVAQFGIGYEYKATKQINIRIEPYLQIPLKGIGIGEVQVMTAGLHLGIIKGTRN